MVGSGPELFAVWGYVIANTVDSQVELNPRHLASLLGMTPQAIIKCIERLCAPDPESRSKVADGRRLIREGEFAYFVPNHAAYRAVRDEQDRREYNRLKKAEGRARGVNVRVKKSKRVKTRVKKSIRESTVSAQAEAEAEAETTRSKALVAPKSGATGQAIMTEFQQLLTTQHLNGAARTAKAKLVFAYWAAKWDHPTAVYDGKRRSRLEARLKENGDNVSELLWVIDGAKRDDWTDRGKYAGIEQLFRDRGAVERLAGMAPGFRNGEPHPMAVKYAGVPEKPHAVG